MTSRPPKPTTAPRLLPPDPGRPFAAWLEAAARRAFEDLPAELAQQIPAAGSRDELRAVITAAVRRRLAQIAELARSGPDTTTDTH